LQKVVDTGESQAGPDSPVLCQPLSHCPGMPGHQHYLYGPVFPLTPFSLLRFTEFLGARLAFLQAEEPRGIQRAAAAMGRCWHWAVGAVFMLTKKVASVWWLCSFSGCC